MPRAKRNGKVAEQGIAEEIAADEAKRSLGELLSRVGFGKERIAITRHGKRIAALVSAQDLERLDGAA